MNKLDFYLDKKNTWVHIQTGFHLVLTYFWITHDTWYIDTMCKKSFVSTTHWERRPDRWCSIIDILDTLRGHQVLQYRRQTAFQLLIVFGLILFEFNWTHIKSYQTFISSVKLLYTSPHPEISNPIQSIHPLIAYTATTVLDGVLNLIELLLKFDYT